MLQAIWIGVSLLLAIELMAQDAPNPEEVYIKRITWAGSGCADSSSVGSNISPDAKAFTLSFSSFIAEVGPGIPNGFSKSKCKITIDLRFPSGWSYTLFSVDYRGEVALDVGVIGTLSSYYYFQSQANNGTLLSSNIEGELFSDFYRRDSLSITEYNWSPCGKNRALNIEAETSVESSDPEAAGAFFLDSIDGELSHVYGIQWQRC